MNSACYRFSLSMQSVQSQVSLPVLLNDTGRILLIELVDNGKPYYINDGCRAVFYAEKADGNILVNDCIIEKNAKIRYDFTAQTASAEGISKCEIRLYGTNRRLITSPKFIMVIDSRVVYDDEVIASHSEFTTIDGIIATEKARAEAEAKRVEAEAERIEAETDRKAAETARAEAEAERSERFDAAMESVIMTGATETTAGREGIVPAPDAGDQDKVLHGDGTWRTPESTFAADIAPVSVVAPTAVNLTADKIFYYVTVDMDIVSVTYDSLPNGWVGFLAIFNFGGFSFSSTAMATTSINGVTQTALGDSSRGTFVPIMIFKYANSDRLQWFAFKTS